jgi:hypothetical protein
VIDEYGLIAEHSELRGMVEYLVTYGMKVGVSAILANQRPVTDMMGSTTIGTQVHIKIYLGMAPDEILAIPKALREQGVRPHLLRQATLTHANDAGKGFVVGAEPRPILVRFHRTRRAEAERRSRQRAADRPVTPEREQRLGERAHESGVPPLLLDVRDAIVQISRAAHRSPPQRASSDEIVTYLAQHGRRLEKTALLGRLRAASGGLIDTSKDMNLAPRNNPKGFRLDDIDHAIATLQQQHAGEAP